MAKKSPGIPVNALNPERRRLLNITAIIVIITAVVLQALFIIFVVPKLSGTIAVDLSSVRAPSQDESYFTQESFVAGSWVMITLIAGAALLFLIGHLKKRTALWAAGVCFLISITSYYAGHILGVSVANILELGENLYRLLIGLIFVIAFTSPYLFKVIREQKPVSNKRS